MSDTVVEGDVQVLGAQEIFVAQVSVVAAMAAWLGLTHDQRVSACEQVRAGMNAAEIVDNAVKVVEYLGFEVFPYEPNPTAEPATGMYL